MKRVGVIIEGIIEEYGGTPPKLATGEDDPRRTGCHVLVEETPVVPTIRRRVVSHARVPQPGERTIGPRMARVSGELRVPVAENARWADLHSRS